MARITGPLLSFGARGSIGKTIVASAWKGRAYMRQHVTPANPNTVAQQAQRTLFRFLNGVFRTMPGIAVEPWQSYALGQVMTDRNAFLKINSRALYEETDLDKLTFSPGAKGGLPTAGSTPVPSDDEIVVTLDPPALPSGWSISKAQAACIVNDDPYSSLDYTVFAAESAGPTWEVTLTGLAATTEYQVCAWFKYSKPDGTFAYGPADLHQVTTTAP